MSKKEKTSGSLTKETRKNMPPRGRSKRTLYLEALMEELGFDDPELAEKDYYQFCIKVGMGRHQYMEETKDGRDVVFGKPDNQLLKDGMARLYPPLKSTLPTYEFDFPIDGTKLQKAEAVINAIGKRDLPIDAGKALMELIKDAATIEEVDDLAERIKIIELWKEGKNESTEKDK